MASINETELPITAIVAYSKGFACACGPGTVHLFEKTDDKDFFRKSREIKVQSFLFSKSLFFILMTKIFMYNLSWWDNN